MSQDDKPLELSSLPQIEKMVIAELKSIAGRVVYDGEVDDDEVSFLTQWLEKHKEFKNKWPISKLYHLLGQIHEDGKVDEFERLQLLMFLSGISTFDKSSAENIFDADPAVHLAGRSFFFAGELEFAELAKARAAVKDQGGKIAEDLDSGPDYFVIGGVAGGQWRTAPYADVVEAVLEKKMQGAGTLIISEADFVRAAIQA